jgi:hypothetical protein
MTQVENTTERPAPMTVEIRKAAAVDRRALTATMARAFDDDPIANWFAAQDKRRARRIYDFMDVAYRITSPHDEVYTTNGDIQGGAYWAPGRKMGMLQQVFLLPP